MTELHGSTEWIYTTLTPRQDRLERAIVDVLHRGGTRSALREPVVQFVDHLRLQGMGVDRTTTLVRALGQRAMPLMKVSDIPAVGDAPADRIAMMVRWCAARYERGD